MKLKTLLLGSATAFAVVGGAQAADLSVAEPVEFVKVCDAFGTGYWYIPGTDTCLAIHGYVQFDASAGKWSLSPEQALCLTDPNGPVDMPGAYNIVEATFHALGHTSENFQSGGGMEWGEHHPCLFEGTERFFRAAYNSSLIGAWLPALDGVVEKLQSGAKVADVGCGHGASTIIMAEAFPNSQFFGFDYHEASIERAREAAEEAGVADSITFEVASAKDYPGEGYDLVCVFDCLHDMGDPVGASAHVLETLDADGTWMIVEPFANDHVEENLNPVGRVFYGASTVICTPASLAQEVGLALGAQAGEARLTEVLKEGGFTRVKRATETPFNLILEARP